MPIIGDAIISYYRGRDQTKRDVDETIERSTMGKEKGFKEGIDGRGRRLKGVQNGRWALT